MKKPDIGSPAPLFTLLDQNEEPIALKDYLNKKTVVVYFYPKAMTPGCTVQACGIRDYKKIYDEKDILVLAISPDEPKRLKKFEDKEKLNFTLLSDPDHTVAEAYGVWGLKKFMGREYDGIHRTTFIIGKDGTLKHILAKVKTKSHHDDILKWIEDNLN